MVAVDAESDESEQWTSKPGAGDDDQEMVQCEYDGDESACRVFLIEFYLRCTKDGVLTMGEINRKSDEVWTSVSGFGEDQHDDEGRQKGSEEGEADTEDSEEASEQNEASTYSYEYGGSCALEDPGAGSLDYSMQP